jgi:F0F1-type ATP synthase assembly protein I
MYNFAALLGAKRTNAMLRQLSKPIRTVLRWQLAATAAMTIAAALLSGAPAAGSAAAGGLISVVAGLASAFVASRSDAKSAGGILFGALRAETVKIGLAVLLLWLVLANYGEAAVGVLVGSFVVTMLIFAMAFFVRDY